MSTYRAATWNLRLGRAVPEVLDFLDTYAVDVAALQEIQGRRKARRLRRLVRDSHRLRLSSNAETGVVVAKTVRMTHHRRHWMSLTGWERKPGRMGLHAARRICSVRVGSRREGFRLATIHFPPKPDSWRFRGLARRQAVAQVRRIGRRWNRAVRRGHIAGWVMAGDWNMAPTDPRITALARELGATVTGTGVDFVLSAGVKVSGYSAHTFGSSDHRPRVFTITV